VSDCGGEQFAGAWASTVEASSSVNATNTPPGSEGGM